MFNIEDYYLGVVVAHPNYFENQKSIQRKFMNPDADPFDRLTKEQAIILGMPVLLKKIDSGYSDYDYSLYRNELVYQLGEANKLGIALVYVKKFTDYFSPEYKVYIYEDIVKNYSLLEDMACDDYYIMHSKIKKEDAVVINNEEIMNKVREDYIQELLTSNGVEINKKMIKK